MTIILGAIAGATLAAVTGLPLGWTTGVGAVMGWQVRIADTSARGQDSRPTSPAFLMVLTIGALVLALAAAGIGAGL